MIVQETDVYTPWYWASLLASGLAVAPGSAAFSGVTALRSDQEVNAPDFSLLPMSLVQIQSVVDIVGEWMSFEEFADHCPQLVESARREVTVRPGTFPEVDFSL